MKKKIAIVLTIVLTLSLLMATVAYAEPGDSQPTDNGQPSAPAQPSNKAAERLQFLEQVKPLLQEIKANHEQIKTMRAEFKALRQQVKELLRNLKQNPEALTDEQIQQLKSLKTQLHDHREVLRGTNANMVQQRQTLRQMRRARNYEGVLAAYGNVVTLQNERMQQLSKMKEICQQILAIG